MKSERNGRSRGDSALWTEISDIRREQVRVGINDDNETVDVTIEKATGVKTSRETV